MTSTATKRFLLVCRTSPYGNALAKEAIDIAFAASVFDQDLAVAFIGEGVWQLHDAQYSSLINSKNHQKLLSALPMYDIDKLYVDAEALQERNLHLSRLSLDAKPLSSTQLASLFEDADIVLNF